MTIRRWLSAALIAALISVLVPVNTWAAGTPLEKDLKPARLQVAIRQAAAQAVRSPALRLKPTGPTKRSGSRMQTSGGGGGHTMMIVSLVSAAVGIGATVYMVKEMEKTTKTIGF